MSQKNLHHRNQKRARRLFGKDYRYGSHYDFRRWSRQGDFIDAFFEQPEPAGGNVKRTFALAIAAVFVLPVIALVAIYLFGH